MTTTTEAIGVADAPPIPGLRFRRLRGQPDYAAIAELLTAGSLADGFDYVPDADSLRVELENVAGFDPRRDLLLAEVDGRVVGFGQAMLGVDAENPTGALGLYESLGFRVKDRGIAYRKPWEPGGRLV